MAFPNATRSAASDGSFISAKKATSPTWRVATVDVATVDTRTPSTPEAISRYTYVGVLKKQIHAQM
jgi:hypothetical protein